MTRAPEFIADQPRRYVGACLATRISTGGSRLRAWFIHTMAEFLFARDTARVVLGVPNPF